MKKPVFFLTALVVIGIFFPFSSYANSGQSNHNSHMDEKIYLDMEQVLCSETGIVANIEGVVMSITSLHFDGNGGYYCLKEEMSWSCPRCGYSNPGEYSGQVCSRCGWPIWRQSQ